MTDDQGHAQCQEYCHPERYRARAEQRLHAEAEHDAKGHPATSCTASHPRSSLVVPIVTATATGAKNGWMWPASERARQQARPAATEV